MNIYKKLVLLSLFVSFSSGLFCTEVSNQVSSNVSNLKRYYFCIELPEQVKKNFFEIQGYIVKQLNYSGENFITYHLDTDILTLHLKDLNDNGVFYNAKLQKFLKALLDFKLKIKDIVFLDDRSIRLVYDTDSVEQLRKLIFNIAIEMHSESSQKLIDEINNYTPDIIIGDIEGNYFNKRSKKLIGFFHKLVRPMFKEATFKPKIKMEAQ